MEAYRDVLAVMFSLLAVNLKFSDAQRTLVLTSEPSLSPGPLCERLVRFTCTGTELPFVLNWVLNGSILAAYSFSSTHTYPFPLAPEPPDSSFPPGVAVNVTSAARNPNVATSIDITTILDASDVSVLNLSSLRCEDSIQLIMSNEINIEVDFRGPAFSPKPKCFLQSVSGGLEMVLQWSEEFNAEHVVERYNVQVIPDPASCTSDQVSPSQNYSCPGLDRMESRSVLITAFNCINQEGGNATFDIQPQLLVPRSPQNVETMFESEVFTVSWNESIAASGSCSFSGAVSYNVSLEDVEGRTVGETNVVSDSCESGICSIDFPLSSLYCDVNIVATNEFGSSDIATARISPPRLTTANQVLLALGAVLLFVAIAGLGVFIIMMKKTKAFTKTLLVLFSEIVLVILAVVLWVAVGFHVGLQDDTCDEGWQNSRDGLIISSFVLSLIILITICICTIGIVVIIKKKRGERKPMSNNLGGDTEELVNVIRPRTEKATAARLKSEEIWYQEEKEKSKKGLEDLEKRTQAQQEEEKDKEKISLENQQKKQEEKEKENENARLEKEAEEQKAREQAAENQYSTTTHGAPQKKVPPASADYSQLGGGTSNIYSVTDHGPGCVQPTGTLEIYDTLAKVPCNTMLKRAKVLKGKFGKFDPERVAAWFPYTRKWPSEHLSETKRLKVYFMNVCRENWKVRDPEEIMKFVQGSWTNCFICGEEDSQIRVKFEDTDFSNWTIIGSPSTFLAKEKEPTMSLNFRNMSVQQVKAMVIHQFGHALGLGHALMKPEEWESIKEYVDVRKMGMACHDEKDEKAFKQQWTGMGVRASVEVNHDEKSVMQYCFSTSWLKNVDLVPETVMEKLKQHEQLSITELSDEDKGALKISRAMTVKDLNALKNKRAEFDLTSELSPMWDTVGLQLEMKKSDLEKFEATEKSKVEKLNMVWTEWLNTDYLPKINFWGNVEEVKYPATWEGLRILLTDLGKGELAQDYFEFIYK